MRGRWRCVRCGLLWLALIAGGLPDQARASGEGIEDFQSWHAVNWTYLSHEQLTLAIYGEIRFDENSTEHSFRLVRHRVGYRAAPWLQLGFNLAYQEIPFDTRDTRGDFRVEWEVTPFFQSEDGLRVSFRNRIELFFSENVDSERWRWRLRLRLDQRLEGFWANRAWISNEFFYDFQPDDFNQNRFIPLGLNFKLTEKVNYGVYVMVLSNLRGDTFEHDFVLGQSLRF